MSKEFAEQCIVCVHVLKGREPILYVGYGSDDDWQFHCNNSAHDGYNIFPIHFHHIYDLDSKIEHVVAELHARGPGNCAVRATAEAPWIFEEIDFGEDGSLAARQ